jgi:phytoene dehydrogenase-like protein
MQQVAVQDRVRVTIEGGVADVRLVRADKMNALDQPMFDALMATGKDLITRPGVRAVVVSGEGRAFCAGLDMGRFEKMADNVQNTLESFFPGFGDLVLQREVVTPLDIEQVAGLPEGNIFHGELLSPQLYFFRPAPGWNQYRTPIDGYYQCGSGTHPGGCVTGGPGRLASMQILGDLRP